MITTTLRWKHLLLFCTGMALAATLSMKLMERDFMVNGERFGILGLELFYDREKVDTIFNSLNEKTASALSYHLYIDFIFMAGIFPAIAALCMIASYKTVSRIWKRVLITTAIFQLLACLLDVTENIFLIQWLNRRATGDHFLVFHMIVVVKWFIALWGVCIGIYWNFTEKRN